MVFSNNLLMGAAGRSQAYDTSLIQNSAWFDGAADYLIRTPGAGNQTEFIIGGWFQRLNNGTLQYLFSSGDASRQFDVTFQSNDTLKIWDADAPINANLITRRIFRDISFYHIVISCYTPDATADNRIRLWINGQEELNFSTHTNPSSSFDLNWNQSGLSHTLLSSYSGTYPAKVYAAQVFCLDGVSIQNGDYTISDLGNFYAVDPDVNIWTPKSDADITGLATSAGGNSFCLDFSVSAALGTDASSNANDFTLNSMDSNNQSNHTPSLVYPTINVIDRSDTGLAILNGGLEFTISNGASGTARTTIPLSAGKFYFECQIDGLPSASFQFGITKFDRRISLDASSGGAAIEIISNGTIRLFEDSLLSSTVDTGVSNAAHTFQCAFDVDTGEVWFGLDDSWYLGGDPATGANPNFTIVTTEELVPCIGRDSSYSPIAEQRLEFGANLGFAGTIPAGFSEINSSNLVTPTNQGPQMFVAVEDTETNIESTLATARSGWGSDEYVDILKNLSASENWIIRFSHDSSNEYTFGTTSTHRAKSTLSGANDWVGNSFRVGATHGIYAGSVSHTNGSDTTVTHSLGTDEVMIWLFLRGTSLEVPVFHHKCTSGKLLNLTGTQTETTDSAIKTVTTTTFLIDTAETTGTYDVLVFAQTENIVLGQYTGNSSTDGPFLNLGFEPEYFATKSKTGYATEWFVYNENQNNPNVGSFGYFTYFNLPNALAAGSTAVVDFLSNSLKIRGASTDLNSSSSTFVYIAIAKQSGNGDYPPLPGK